MRLNLARDHNDEARAFHRFTEDVNRPRLTLVAANGGRRSRSYVEIKEIQWHPDLNAIILTMLDARVTIYGRNLMGLCMMLEEHEIGLIEERHSREDVLGAGEVFVERIDWDDL